LSSWLIALACGLGGLLAGAAAAALAVRRAQRAGAAAAGRGSRGPLSGESEPTAEPPLSGRPELALLERALREPLARLRRAEGCPPELLERFERLASQFRMLTSAPRPMKARPTSPIDLLQGAAEQVTLLRLGKVGASWTLRGRQPVHVDPERATAAFRELPASSAEAEGEGGRLASRIERAGDARYPVGVEIELGRRNAEPDPLGMLVARRVLEGQGARVLSDGARTRVLLRSLPVEPESQTPSNT
jgi:hypothetical protein